jgi:hypothetical protein
MALEQFAAAGVPVDPARFRLAVTRMARLPRAGEMPSGPQGGRGQVLYDISQLQLLHKDVAKWIPAQDTAPP